MDAKNTVPVTIWGVPVWKGGGRQKNLHLGTPRNHKVFVPIWGLTYENSAYFVSDWTGDSHLTHYFTSKTMGF